jgi:hypothetical protein
MLQQQSPSSSGTTKSLVKTNTKRAVEIVQPQDHLLREVVRLMEASHRDNGWTWGWLSEKSELTPAGYYAWRTGKTRGVWLRKINSVLKPLGYRLRLEKTR